MMRPVRPMRSSGGTAPEVGTVLLESGMPDPDGGRSLLFGSPSGMIELPAGGDPHEFLAALQRHLDRGRWLAGYLAFEAGYALLGLPEPPWVPATLAWFGSYDRPRPLAVAQALGESSGATGFRFEPSREGWRAQVGEVHERIRAGTSYQVNLTGRMRFDAEAGGWAAYRAWSRAQPVPFAAYLRPSDEREIVSLSPELFVRSDGRSVWTRPMKGTAARGATPEEDRRLAEVLQADPKTRAENVMIVDMLRNDLGRVAEFGTVEARPLFEIERYATLLQMTSTVRATLRDDLRGRALPEVLSAMFPCGSVTGAPKRSTVTAIAEIEAQPRGVYTGAIGYAAPGGEFVFNVAIRTAEVAAGVGVLGLGGGILIDSDADAEYDEALLKGTFARSA